MIRRFRRLILFLVGFTIPIQAEAVTLGPLGRATPFKFVTGALFVLAGLQLAQRAGRRVPDSKTYWVLAFGVSWTMGLAISTAAGLPARQVFSQGSTMLALVAYYYLIGFIVRRRDDFGLLLWALVLGGAVTAAPAVLCLQAASGGERFTGLSGQENRLGSDMTVCLSVALALFLNIRSTLGRAVLAGCMALALGGIFLSLSRAAFLSLACIWVFWLVRSGSAGALRWVVPAVLLAVGAILAAPESVERRIDTMVNPQLRKEDESIQSRFVTGMWGVKAFASNPLLGIGANRFPAWVHEHPKTQGLPWLTLHNAYLSLAAELGLFGLVPFIGMLVLTWADYAKSWRAARARRMLRDPTLNEYATYSVALQAALLGCMVSAMFHQTHQSKPLWTVLAMAPVLVGLIRARIEELGTVTRDEPSLFPAFSDAAPLPAGRLPARS